MFICVPVDFDCQYQRKWFTGNSFLKWCLLCWWEC